MRNYIETELQKKKKWYADNYAQMVGLYKNEIKTTKDYNGRQLLELIQNADDAGSDSILIRLDKEKSILSISNNGIPFTKEGYRSLMISDLTSKIKKKYIGNKGLGFRSIINWSDKIRIKGNGIIVEFSEEQQKQAYSDLFDEETRNNINNEFSFKENINPIPFLSIPYVTILNNIDDYITTIEIQYKDTDKIFEDILNQVHSLKTEILLFLNNITRIEFEGFENIGNIEIIGDKKLEHPIKIQDNEWVVYEKSGLLDEKYQDNISEEKEYYQVKIAIPKNFENKTNLLFTFFPTKVDLDFPFVIHGTFDLDSSRNQLIESDKNKFVLEQLIHLILYTSKKIAKGQISWQPIELLKYKNENTVLSNLDFYTTIKKKIRELELFPCLDNKYRNIEDTIIISNTFSSFINKTNNQNIFNNLLLPINQDLKSWLIEIGLSFNKLKKNEFVKRIDFLSSKLKTINERVELIYILENDSEFYSHKEQYSLLLNENKKIIDKNIFVFTPPTTKSQNFDIPDFVKIDFLNKNLYRKLLIKFDLINSKEKPRELQRRLKKITKISPFEPAPIIEKIITETNKQTQITNNKKEENIFIKKMTVSLFNNYKDIKESTKPDTSKARIISKSGKAKLTNELFLSSEYPSGILTEDLFKQIFPKNFFVAGIKTIGLDKEVPIEVENFLVEFLGVNKNTKFISNFSPEHDYNSFVFKKNGRPENIRNSNVKTTKIDHFNLIIENIKTEELIIWLIKDMFINKQLNNSHNDDTFKYDKKSEWTGSYYHSIDIKPSYIKYQILSKRSFSDILVNNDKLSFINESNIDFQAPLFNKYNITRNEINDLLLELGAKSYFSDLSINRISDIIKSLEFKDPKGKNAQKIYKLAYEHYKKNKQSLICENGVKYFAQKGNIKEFFSSDNVYYTDNLNLPKKIVDKHAILHFPKRMGEEQVSSFFNIKTFKDYNFEIESKKVNYSITQELNKYLFSIKPYFLSIRLDKISADNQKQINAEVNSIKNLNIEICDTITCKNEENIIDLEEMDFIINKGDFHIKVTSLHNLTDLKNNPKFCDVISEIITMKLKINEDKNNFRFYFKNDIEDTEHSVITEYGLSVLQEAKSLLNMSDYQKNFWQVVFKLKKCNLIIDENLNEQIRNNLKKDFSDIVDKIDYQYLSDIRNFEFIRTIFSEVSILIKDFNSESNRKIYLNEKHIEDLRNFFFNQEKKFKSTLWYYLNKKEDGTQKDFLNIISRFEDFDYYIKNKAQDFKDKFIMNKQEIFDEFIIQNFHFHELNKVSNDITEKYDENKSIFTNQEKDIIEQDIELKSLLYFEKNLDILKEKLKLIVEIPDETINEEENDDKDGLTVITDFTVNPVAIPDHTGTSTYTPKDSNKKNKKTGNRSERKVKRKLVELYGNDYVSQKSKEDEGLQYDIRYSPDKGKSWKFVEVKTFNNNRFYLSNEEKLFGEKNKDDYEIWLVQDSLLFPYKMFLNNDFEITPKYYIVSLEINNTQQNVLK